MTVFPLFKMFRMKVSCKTLDNKLCKEKEKERDYGLIILKNCQSF